MRFNLQSNAGRTLKFVWGVVGILASAPGLQAVAGPPEAVAGYDFEGASLAASVSHTFVSASDFVYSGSGATAFESGDGSIDAYRATGWPSDASLDNYFGFTVTIDPGFVLDVTRLDFASYRSPLGPINWLVRYSTDGATFGTVGSGLTGVESSFHSLRVGERPPLDLTGTVVFRFHGMNAGGATGRWRLDDVTLRGVVRVDTGHRTIRYRGYDSAILDTWGATTNAGSAVVQTSADRAYSGTQSLKMTGSSNDANPSVVFDNVLLTNGIRPRFSIAYAADGPDLWDDLKLAVSHNDGGTWNGAGSVKMVAGFDNAAFAFGTTNASEPASVSANPYAFSISTNETQVRVRVTFDDRGGTTNTADHYYIDDVRLQAITAPPTNAPSISNYGGVSGVTERQAGLSGHVRGGYPYPDVTLYWGPVDGGSNASAWSHETGIGEQNWGLFTNTLAGLDAGQVYYYRCYARNLYGSAWADGSTSFTTDLSALGASGTLYLDSFGVGTAMPLAIDGDGDGVSDTWENYYFGSTTNGDGTADRDGDGWTDEQEFIAGTHPTNADSFLRIVGVDLVSEASDDIVVTWTGGTHNASSPFSSVGDRIGRTFRINAAALPATNQKGRVATVLDTLLGVNTWTDTAAANNFTKRYYELSPSFGGVSYTNTEEWAMYVQDRPVNQAFLVCVPVNYGTARNNLNADLGSHLARGLHAGTTTGTADRMRYFDTYGSWNEYYLFTNATYGRFWSDGGPSPVDVSITPGQALWVVRAAGSVVRTDTVFSGRSFNSGTVTNMTFATTDSGWTMFGWPLAQARRHRSAAADGSQPPPVNQLGFAALGSGGTTSDTRMPSSWGDRIWVWRNNEWETFYWLMGHIGPNWDGRWWDDRTRDFADFSLEPGVGYYYRNVTNQWGGAAFDWTPEAP